jgi:hypothetical protein
MMPGFEGPPVKASRIYRSVSMAGAGFGLYDPTVLGASEYTAGVIPASNQSGAMLSPMLPINGGGGGGDGCKPRLGPCDSNCMRTVTPCEGKPYTQTCCAAGFHCESGKCVCPAPNTACGMLCRNLQTDPNNCGTCGNGCNSGTCVGGKCSGPAASGLTPCGGNALSSGYWFFGRPTLEDLRQDLRAVLKKCRPDWGYHNAGNEGRVAARPQRALLSLRQNVRPNSR